MLERYLEFAIARSIDIDASPDEVWKILTDIDNFPDVFWNVTSVERLDGSKAGSAIKVGSRNRIHRQTKQGERYFGDWTVTALEPGRSITFYSPNIVSDGMTSTTTWSVAPAGCKPRKEQEQDDKSDDGDDMTNNTSPGSQGFAEKRASWVGRTSELVQQKLSWGLGSAKGNANSGDTGEDPSKSVASITLAIMPTKLFLVAGRILCCCFYKKRASSVTEEDLEDLAKAATKTNK